LTPHVEDEILKAMDAIHSLGVIHNDIRAANILIGEDRKSVWMVDFESARINPEGEEQMMRETRAIHDLLRRIKLPGWSAATDV
jgi:serine/threonine protein kinase